MPKVSREELAEFFANGDLDSINEFLEDAVIESYFEDYDDDYLFNDWDYEDPIFYSLDDDDIEPIDYGPYHYLN